MAEKSQIFKKVCDLGGNEMYCSQRGCQNDKNRHFCFKCGSAIASTNGKPNSWQISEGSSSDVEELYKAVIGPKDKHVYLPSSSR